MNLRKFSVAAFTERFALVPGSVQEPGVPFLLLQQKVLLHASLFPLHLPDSLLEIFDLLAQRRILPLLVGGERLQRSRLAFHPAEQLSDSMG